MRKPESGKVYRQVQFERKKDEKSLYNETFKDWELIAEYVLTRIYLYFIV